MSEEKEFDGTSELIGAIDMLERIRKMAVIKSQSPLLERSLGLQQLFSQTLVDLLSTSPDGLTALEKNFARENKKIEAIKAVRSRTNTDLATANNMVKKWMEENGINPFGGQR